MKDKAIWLQEYLASGKLDDAFKEGLRRELPSTSPKELEGFLKVCFSCMNSHVKTDS